MMLSDNWYRQGFSCGKKIQVSDFVFFKIWHDEAGKAVGATVDFETANDYHYEMPISEWNKFLEKVLSVKDADKATAAFQKYLATNKGLFDFESDLQMRGIGFQKIFF